MRLARPTDPSDTLQLGVPYVTIRPSEGCEYWSGVVDDDLWDAGGAGCACTDGGPWTAPAVLTGAVPAAFDEWRTARKTSTPTIRHDPTRVFSNTFLDTLLP